jgi:hypothetical protein
MCGVTIRLIGANPLLGLYDGERRTAVVAVWRVDWSERGAGRAVVLWHDGRPRLIGPDPDLARWLADEFTRHFDEYAGLPWPDPAVTVAPIDLELDLTSGLRVTADDVEVEIAGPPLYRRLFTTETFDLGGVEHGLSTVVMPCETGRLRIGGSTVPGTPKVPSAPGVGQSTAFLADAEVWWSLGNP